MRRKMRGREAPSRNRKSREAPSRKQKSGDDDLKHVEGGVIDLEFCVQALVLADGPAHPELRENKGNHTLLHRAAECGLVDPGIAAAAADAYLAMRRRIHEAALNDEETVRLAQGELAAERAAVRRLWAALFESEA
jgi:[glutamine synthetase] adenylyltransferase / [glutamine synthetase]-adenylyl-L-tyrosine phosphorylase